MELFLWGMAAGVTVGLAVATVAFRLGRINGRWQQQVETDIDRVHTAVRENRIYLPGPSAVRPAPGFRHCAGCGAAIFRRCVTCSN